MPVRVPGQLDDAPAVEVAALVEQVRVERVADERRKGMALLDQVVGDGRRHAMGREPRRHPLRPVLAPPYPLALRVVESALEDGRAGHRGSRSRAPDVIRVEMRDRDPLHRDGAPGRVAESEPGVVERTVDEAAVDVLGPGRLLARWA